MNHHTGSFANAGTFNFEYEYPPSTGHKWLSVVLDYNDNDTLDDGELIVDDVPFSNSTLNDYSHSVYFWNDVENGKDLLTSIASRYVDRIPCPSKDWEERKRIPHILNLCKDWNVDGVIIMQQKFCDPHELDFVSIKKALEDAGIPTLFLEFDVTVPIGQFKIRVEAFLEMIGEEDLF